MQDNNFRPAAGYLADLWRQLACCWQRFNSWSAESQLVKIHKPAGRGEKWEVRSKWLQNIKCLCPLGGVWSITGQMKVEYDKASPYSMDLTLLYRGRQQSCIYFSKNPLTGLLNPCTAILRIHLSLSSPSFCLLSVSQQLYLAGFYLSHPTIGSTMVPWPSAWFRRLLLGDAWVGDLNCTA